jgi:serine protein kinase
VTIEALAKEPKASGDRHSALLKSLTDFTKEHRAARWGGTLAEFLQKILPTDARNIARTSHQYMWDMMRDQGSLFENELFGIDGTIERVRDYFKAAAAGSEVGRRLLLLLGPPSGGKSSMVILLKRGLEAYSRTEAGALYGIQGCPVHESPLHLVPATLRGQFRDSLRRRHHRRALPALRAAHGNDSAATSCRCRYSASSSPRPAAPAVGTYAPHDPTTADIADLVGSVDLSKVAEFGDEGDPRAWSWSGAVFAASRGMLEMIEILKVKREFLYLLLTLTQEKNVKVSRFPLIHLDETIIAHTNLAEFRKFLQEPENEALLDRMVIIQVPYTLSYKEEARIYRKLCSSTQAFREVHLDPHALHVAAVFSVLTRLAEAEEARPSNSKKVRLYAGDDVEGMAQSEAEKIKARNPDEGLSGISPRFVINALSNAIIQSSAKSLTTMEVLIALKDAIESDMRIDGKKKRKWVDFLVAVRKEFYNRWVKEDVHKALFVSFEAEAQQLLDKYLDEVEATLDNRTLRDPITSEERKPDERFLRNVEEKIRISESGKVSFRQEVVRKAMGAFKRGEKFTLDSHAPLHDAWSSTSSSSAATCCAWCPRARGPTTRRAEDLGGREAPGRRVRLRPRTARVKPLNYVTTLLAQE